MEATLGQMKCSLQEDESASWFFIHMFMFSTSSNSQGVQNHPERQAFGWWAWPILLVRRWDNFIPKMNETNFVSQNTQGKSTFLEKSGMPFAWHWGHFYKRPSCPFPQGLRRCTASLEAWPPEGTWNLQETKELTHACPPPPRSAAASAVTLGWLRVL